MIIGTCVLPSILADFKSYFAFRDGETLCDFIVIAALVGQLRRLDIFSLIGRPCIIGF